MSFDILNHIYFSLAIIDVIIFFEILFTSKNNKNIRTILLILIFAGFWHSCAHIYCDYFGYNRLLLNIPITIFSVTFLFLYSSLGYNKIIKPVFIFFGLAIFTQLVALYYVLFYDFKESSIIFNDVNIFGDYLAYIKILLIVIFLVLSFKIYLEMKKRYIGDNIYYIKIKKWSLVLFVSIVIISTTGATKNLIGYENLASKYLSALSSFLIAIAILFRPKFLNTSFLNLSLSNIFNKNSGLNTLSDIFDETFYKKLYFLNASASLEDMSKKLKTPTSVLYRYVYDNYKSSFTDLTNLNRVNYFIELAKSEKHNHYTIDALAQLSGFTSRHHFYRPFKKFHGGVPSDFLKSLGR